MKLITTPILLTILFSTSSQALPIFEITEIYNGISGNDGSADWFEIVNVGDSIGDTGTLFFDDESADPTKAGQLDSFILVPGGVAIFLIDDNASSINEFTSVWGNVANVGLTNGGGSLGKADDGVFLFDSSLATANLIDNALYGSQGATLATMEVTPTGTVTVSSLGINGAYTSNAFANDNFGGSSVSLTGSPGVAAVPIPAAIWLFASSLGLLGLRKKRQNMA